MNTLPANQRSENRKCVVIYALLIVAAVMAVFGPVVRHEFAGFDDSKSLYWNEHLGRPLGTNISWYWTHPYMHLYTPMIFTVWNLLAAVAKTEPTGAIHLTFNPAIFHAASLMVHAVNALLVFTLLQRLVKRDGAACLGALLFAMHPLQVETVAWASGLKDLLFTMLSLVSLWQYLVAAESGKSRPYAISLVALLLALLSKPAAVMVPVLAAVIDFWLLGSASRLVAKRVLPMVIIGGVMAVVGRYVQPPSQAALIGLAWRPLVVADTVAFYLRKLAMPWDLAAAYGRSPNVARASGALMWTWVIPLVAGLCVWAWRKNRPWLVVGVLLFVLAPLPVLGWIRFDYQRLSTVADHYLYLAMLGPALLLASGRGRLFASVSVCLLITLGIDSSIQLRNWRTNVAVWEHAISVAPQCPEAHENLAFAYRDLGPGHAEAEVRELRIATSLKPNEIRDHDLLSGSLISAGKVDEAIEEMKLVMRLQERHDASNAKLPNERLAAYLSLGDLLLVKGRADEAAEMYRKILRQLPGDRTAREHLHLCVFRLPNERPALRTMLGSAAE